MEPVVHGFFKSTHWVVFSTVEFEPVIERSQIETLATGAWVCGKETVLLQGPPGVRKTHLAVSLGVRTVQFGFSAQYYRFDELVTALETVARLRLTLPPYHLRLRPRRDHDHHE
ncbi:MAG: ATP-binding protein [Pseudomonadota bacterium]